MTPSTDQIALAPATRSALELRLEADAFWLSPLRAMVTDAALHAEFDLESAADLTMAVDEAVAMLIAAAGPGEQVTAHIEVTPAGMCASVRLPGTERLRVDGFGWRVLCALTDSVELLPGGAGIQLVKERDRPDG